MADTTELLEIPLTCVNNSYYNSILAIRESVLENSVKS